MKRIEWRDEFSVGVEEIDAQHRQLIGLINELADAKGADGASDLVSDILSRLVDYVAYHFGNEEKYMVRFDYEDLVPHRQEHRAFIRKVQDLRRGYLEDRETLSDDLSAFLMEWLETHILGTDRKYRQCFHEHGLT